MNRTNVLAIPATSRRGSVQQEVIKKFSLLNTFDVGVNVYDKLADLPIHGSNPEEDPSEFVVKFCQMVRASDVVLLYLPEITFGVPGTLNNALKWALSFDIFKDKFVLLVTTAKPKNTRMQEIINNVSSQLYPLTKLRIYTLPHNLGPENQKAELQTVRVFQNMLADVRQHAGRKKILAVA